MSRVSPYRTHPSRRDPILDTGARAASYLAARRRLVVAGTLVAAAAVVVPFAMSALRPRRPKAEVPRELLDAAAVFPAPYSERPSVPLEPLLAADAPDRLAVVEPSETALNLRPAEPLTIRFNRPMVEGAKVGKPVDRPVIVFDPPIEGRAVWTSRSTLAFEGSPGAWRKTRTTKLSLSTELRSLAGEELEPIDPKTVVFDAGPRLLREDGSGRLMPGEPLRLLFSGKVDAHELPGGLMMYEVDGGRRSIPFFIEARPVDARGRTPVDVLPRRSLEPGARSRRGRPPHRVRRRVPARRRGRVYAAAAHRGRRVPAGGDATPPIARPLAPPGRIVDIGESLVVLLATGRTWAEVSAPGPSRSSRRSPRCT